MPVPRSKAAQRTLIRGAMRRKARKFPSGSSASIAREALARKFIKKGMPKNQAYATATAAIKRGMKSNG